MGFSVAVKEIMLDKITFSAGEKIFIEGHRGISSYTPEEMVVRITGGTVVIKGESLEISEMNGDELSVTGKIRAVERRKKGEKAEKWARKRK